MYNPDVDYQVMLAKPRAICRNKNIAQYALAKAIGMSTYSMSCLMRGETKPYVYMVLTICGALDVTIADLLEKQVLSTMKMRKFLLVCTEYCFLRKKNDKSLYGHAVAI